MATPANTDIVTRLLNGDRRALARVVTLIENRASQAQRILAQLHAYTGRAHIIGITGSPGAGKSTLVMQLARELRRRERTVGVIAVDPSSPFTGGAILGDRIRMQELAGDPHVFIRSMATPGSLVAYLTRPREPTGGASQTTGLPNSVRSRPCTELLVTEWSFAIAGRRRRNPRRASHADAESVAVGRSQPVGSSCP